MLPTNYQSFIHQSRYSRWMEKESRRETWDETVTRLLDFYRSFLQERHSYSLTDKIYALHESNDESGYCIRSQPYCCL